jgi:hypothetical protein
MKTVPEMTQAVARANPMPSAFDGLPCASCYLAAALAAAAKAAATVDNGLALIGT